MSESLMPGAAPVNLDEARGWLRMGATVDDAVVAQLVRAATNICEAFIGRWLIVRAATEVLPLRAGTAALAARPVVGIDSAILVSDDDTETVLGEDDYRLSIARDGTARLAVPAAAPNDRLRIAYRAGMGAGANDIPEAIRQGIVRMTQHMHEARDDKASAPPAMIAALWQPWRRIGLGGGA